MAETIVTANGIEICTEAFGDPAHPPVLLIMGATGQSIYWEDEFCQGLVAGDRYVLRFDNRDTGKSTCIDFDAHPYTLRDLANDAIGVLDAYGLPSAHVVGVSMGGMVAQIMAIEHRSRVRSLTSISATPLAGTGMAGLGGEASDELSVPARDVAERIAQAWLAIPVDRDEWIEWRVKTFSNLAGTFAAFDWVGFRKIAIAEIDRARNFLAVTNHMRAMEASEPKDRRPALRKLDVPALVIHGTADQIFHLEHGKATAQAIRGAKLLAIENVGHELPRAAWPMAIAEILAHTRRAEDLQREEASL